MTGRDEVEAMIERLEGQDAIPNRGEVAAMLRTLAAENAALRERLEAAQRLVSEAEAQRYKSCAELMTRALASEAALTEARAQAGAGWMAGRDAAKVLAEMYRDRWPDLAANDAFPDVKREYAYMVRAARIIAEQTAALTPPPDHTAALSALLDAEWNAALEAIRKGMMIENGSSGDHTIRALRRTTEASHD